MNSFQKIVCLMAIFSIFSIFEAQADRQPQRRGGDGTSSSSSSSTTEATTPFTRRSRAYRRSTTPLPSNPNNDLIRKGLIDKLCARKYGKGSTTVATTSTTTATGSPTVSSTLLTSTSTSTTLAPASTKLRSRSRSRSARAARVTSTAAPTLEPSCRDFDDLTFEQLVNRNKAGLRPARRRESTLKSDA